MDIPFLPDSPVLFYVTHLSYDDLQQCHSIPQLVHELEKAANSTQIIMGDMNTYLDFEWYVAVALLILTDIMDYIRPMDILTKPWHRLTFDSKHNPCAASNAALLNTTFVSFSDVWEEHARKHSLPMHQGQTFPILRGQQFLMDPCRPDRILFRNAPGAAKILKLINVETLTGIGGSHEVISDHAAVVATFMVA